MKPGPFPFPSVALAAVAGVSLLVIAIVWGVWRARRSDAPEPLDVAPPAAGPQPSAEDWTGEAAGGPADPPRPEVVASRTVADIVAERSADTGPIPGLPLAAAPSSRRGMGSVLAPTDERPDAATLARISVGPRRYRPGSGPYDEKATARRRPSPGSRDAGTTTPPPADPRWGPAEPSSDDAGGAVSSRVGEDDDLSRPPNTGAEAGTASGPRASADAPDPVAGDPIRPDTGADEGRGAVAYVPETDSEDAGTDGTAAPTARDLPAVHPDPVDPGPADTASRIGPAVASGAPLPPWSAERSVPARDEPGVGSMAEPVSRAVQQALAARAVQRAQRIRPAVGDPEPQTGQQQELPLAIVPSPAEADAGPDARDRLLGVLLADPDRAVDATEQLDHSQERIEQLGIVLRRRNDDLAGAVRHLHECGLDAVQIGRLAAIPESRVRTILDGEDAGRG